MIDTDGLAHHLLKWRTREPEMAQAEVFCPPAQRARMRAFGCLLAEWEDALLGPSEVQVAASKLMWWAEELAAGGLRHPLARELAGQGVAVADLQRAPYAAACLLETELAGDLDAALQACANYAQALVAASASAFAAADASPTMADPTTADSTTTDSPTDGNDNGIDFSIALLRRAALHAASGHPLARDRLPLNLLARHGSASADAVRQPAFHQEFATALLARLPTQARLPLFRSLRRGFERQRLRQMLAGKVVSTQESSIGPFRVLWTAWNAARHAA